MCGVYSAGADGWCSAEIERYFSGTNVIGMDRVPFDGDDELPKKIWLHIAGMFVCGFVLQFSYEVSGGTAWSILVSSINSSPWEWTKPFVLVYMMWSFIEMSCCRPHLLHYVCARILSLHTLTALCLGSLCLLKCWTANDYVILGVIFCCLAAAEFLMWLWYRSKCRFELFFVPIILSLVLLFGCLLFCSLYPLPLFCFR